MRLSNPRARAITLTVLALALAACSRAASPGSEAGLPTPVELEPAGPSIDGWEETSIDGVTCRHPEVRASCADGWCRVPSGCFIMGSPEDELWRGRSTERLTAVTLTQAIEIAQYELTWKEWAKLVPIKPTKPPQVIEEPTTCDEPDCPLRYATWFEGLRFANLLSERHDPPLPPCYELSGCQGELGDGMTCTKVSLSAPSPYECVGYRLPTEAEWEYAARAGTRTAYYSGGISTTDSADIAAPEPNLDAVAWSRDNSKNRTQPVGRKRPNRWSLFDMLGNVAEWTNDQATFGDPPGPLENPATAIGITTEYPNDDRVTRGSTAAGTRGMLRVASRSYTISNLKTMGVGIRLVRSLPSTDN